MSLDRMVQFERATSVDDGRRMSKVWAALGEPVPAGKLDVSDSERWRSASSEETAEITTRFRVRYTAFTASITPKDRLVSEGVTYDISGAKEGRGRRAWIEITCAARSDR
ncbi:head-tail adaptor protein [Palleronia sp. LCG004]|uniref:head-tail adaptor protein n=1 Tax=Palleronia sp. LCG004 TaxID=3079304 RepID=UPI0029425804|nr:head-tail adaptor protein [Palleronia sp. LCG004]WOI54961.1 head-tail adaptor protein [Palleronia sp. LCG004]